MNIAILKVKKAQLQTDIANAIGPILEEFKSDTGLSIQDMDISMTEVSSFSEPTRNFILGRVQVSLAIGL